MAKLETIRRVKAGKDGAPREFYLADKAALLALVSEAVGFEVGSIIKPQYSPFFYIYKPMAEAAETKAEAKPEPKASAGPASDGISAQQLMAQMVSMLATMQGLAKPAQEASPALQGLNLGAPSKGKGASPKRRVA